MAKKSGFFQARLSAALLRCAALAGALVLLALPAHAEVVTLVCQAELGFSATIRIDYDRKTVDLVNSEGSAAYRAPATITEGGVAWNLALPSSGEPLAPAKPHFWGSLNRLSGQGLIEYPHADRAARGHAGVTGPCRRATQKF